MTGTPMPNTPENLWGQFFFLNRYGFFLDKKFYDFQQEYMEKIDLRPKAARYDRLGRFIPLKPRDPSRWMPRKTTKERLKSFIDSCAYRVRMKDHLKDMPPLTKIVREIEMASDQLGHYKTMKNELRVVIDDERLTVNTKLTQLMKLRQITGGFIIDQNQVTHEIPDNPKMLELDDIIETEIPEGEKFIIFAQYRYEIESLISRYKHLGVVSVYGGNTSNKNLDNIDIFLKDPTVRCIVLHPASAAHGITFTNSHYMIFYSIDASAELNYQAVKRIERNGQKHPMIVWYLLCDNSIDQHLYKTIKKKLLDQEETIDGESVNEESFAKFLLNEIRRDYLNEHITTKHGS
jgi:SNF2 family DNA or RNA helicase